MTRVRQITNSQLPWGHAIKMDACHTNSAQHSVQVLTGDDYRETSLPPSLLMQLANKKAGAVCSRKQEQPTAACRSATRHKPPLHCRPQTHKPVLGATHRACGVVCVVLLDDAREAQVSQLRSVPTRRAAVGGDQDITGVEVAMDYVLAV